MIVLMFVLMFLLFVLTVPVATSLGLASAITVLGLEMPAGLVVQRFFSGLNSFTLLAIPFFILAGALMESAGISQRIVDFVATADCLLPLRHLRLPSLMLFLLAL